MAGNLTGIYDVDFLVKSLSALENDKIAMVNDSKKDQKSKTST
jgi:hypothetical protein